MDFLLGNKDYPLKAEWYEHNPKQVVDEEDTWEAPVPFTYKDITRSKRNQQDIQGLRKATLTVVIETRAKLDFKQRDKIVLDRGQFKVTDVELVPDTNYNAKQIFTNLNLNKTVLTLQ